MSASFTPPPLLPRGIRVDSGIGEDEEPVVRLTLTPELFQGEKPKAPVVLALRPRHMRALGALLIRQADQAEQRPVLRSIDGGRR